MPHLATGDGVRLTYEGRTVEAVVGLASPNGKSLALLFDGALHNSKGMFVGQIPLLWHDDAGEFRDIVDHRPAKIEKGRFKYAAIEFDGQPRLCAYTTEQAPGAWPNGSRVRKLRTEVGEKHPVGSMATILGSHWIPAAETPDGKEALSYFVIWDATPGIPVGLVATPGRLERVE